MCNGLLGKKLGMTSYFSNDGRYLPVTVIEAGPCTVTQVKTRANDGYDALQLGFLEKKKQRLTRPLQGHFEKNGNIGFARLREFSVDSPGEYEPGQKVTLEMFSVGDKINIAGNTKGRGFAGVVKRHGFRLGRKTHGGRCYRLPGSIGQSAWPSKVAKGKKMPGRYGNKRQTMRNLEVVDIRPEQNLILVKGAVPGPKNAVIEISKAGKA
ncbi:MAG: 50S ribosomal protein L3 [Desulfobacteraceae bacterium]|nr:50S ribosomal protein L3 [Desulfobacteraceae bacterium]MCF8093891.1 50S ribosomal protein L3 [Desulfobacteraceae bacterium]